MDTHLTDLAEEPGAETPEDVAILYSWANLHGAKYRDFSASRREYRAQVRHRAAEETRRAELNAQAEAERAAAAAEQAAREAERTVRQSERAEIPVSREQALHEADEAARRALTERVEAARRAEAAAIAEAAARRESREIADAQSSAARQTARWQEASSRPVDGGMAQAANGGRWALDPYEAEKSGAPAKTEVSSVPAVRAPEFPANERLREESVRGPERRTERAGTGPGERLGERRAFRPSEPEASRSGRGYRPDQPFASQETPRVPGGGLTLGSQTQAWEASRQKFYIADSAGSQEFALSEGGDGQTSSSAAELPTPAWLYGGQTAPPAAIPAPTPLPANSAAEALQHSRERVASRWFALQGVFEGESVESPAASPVRQKEIAAPVLAVFSLAGGVGKTSLVATLGRALSSRGEKVLLADLSPHGLLPYYFGATGSKPGVVRTFSPPSGSADAPIHLASYGFDSAPDERQQEALTEEIFRGAGSVQRVLLDLNGDAGWMIRRLVRAHATILIPLAPDMNSVLGLQATERLFREIVDAEGKGLLPFYVINQFDASLPLHLDVREVLRGQLGDRLLPYVLRRSPAVSEALAEGLTVIDYVPDEPIASDFLNIANWLHDSAVPGPVAARTLRWSER